MFIVSGDKEMSEDAHGISCSDGYRPKSVPLARMTQDVILLGTGPDLEVVFYDEDVRFLRDVEREYQEFFGSSGKA